jgi:hypothetical protein
MTHPAIRWSPTRLRHADCGPRLIADASGLDKGGPFAFRGSAFHEAAAAWVEARVEGQPVDEIPRMELLEKAIRERAVPPTLQPELRLWWDRWTTRWEPPDAPDFIGAELRLDLDRFGDFFKPSPDAMGHSPEARAAWLKEGGALVAIADLVIWEGRRLVVVDWKGQRNIESTSDQEKDPQTVLEVALLARFLELDPGETVVFRRVYYAYDGRGDKAARWGGSVRDTEHRVSEALAIADAWIATTRAVDDLAPDDAFWTEPHATPTCRYCPIREECSIYVDPAAEGTPGMAVELEKRTKAIKAALRKLAKDEPVEAGGLVARYAPKPVKRWDVGRTIAELVARGLDPLGALKVDSYGLKRVAGRALRELEESAACEHDEDSRFDIVQVPRQDP